MDDSLTKRALSFVKWKNAANQLLLDDYCITTDDADLHDTRLKSHWAAGETPKSFIDWFAEKYALISKRDVGGDVPPVVENRRASVTGLGRYAALASAST